MNKLDPKLNLAIAKRLSKHLSAIRAAHRNMIKVTGATEGKSPVQSAIINGNKKSILWSLDGVVPKKRIIKNNTLTFKELFKVSWKSRKINAIRDKVTIVMMKISKKNPNKINSRSLTYQRKEGKSTKYDIRSYKHVLIKLEPDKKFTDSKVLFSCSCPDHMFTWEYALTKRGNSQIIFSNGEPADLRNPRNSPGLCKHGIALFRAILAEKK